MEASSLQHPSEILALNEQNESHAFEKSDTLKIIPDDSVRTREEVETYSLLHTDEDLDDEDEDSAEDVMEIDEDGLVSIYYCISCLFVDENEASERTCRLCLCASIFCYSILGMLTSLNSARYTSGLVTEAPKPFIHPAVETLVTHCQQEHRTAWEHLRQPQILDEPDS